LSLMETSLHLFAPAQGPGQPAPRSPWIPAFAGMTSYYDQMAA
jgi:hypothetical protein